MYGDADDDEHIKLARVLQKVLHFSPSEAAAVSSKLTLTLTLTLTPTLILPLTLMPTLTLILTLTLTLARSTARSTTTTSRGGIGRAMRSSGRAAARTPRRSGRPSSERRQLPCPRRPCPQRLPRPPRPPRRCPGLGSRARDGSRCRLKVRTGLERTPFHPRPLAPHYIFSFV